MELKVPPPIVFLICAGMMRLVAGRRLVILYTANIASIRLAAIILILALVIGGAGLAAFQNAGTTFEPRRPGEASTLVRGGIYARTRNPMYLGLALSLTAWAVYLGDFGAALFVPAFVVYMTIFQIKPEERALSNNFGQAYDEYRAAVRRWL